eukprot:TRINITY_DN3599_c0_g1_i1.p1 TRINITY_DN3599_c0_g1~~TRINITY_DN3599_c0_g1_i1.p1  ORF type:complete len:125 (+),score=24.98 TRINITY_DN3599_c0_g1_i1:24-377(+)
MPPPNEVRKRFEEHRAKHDVTVERRKFNGDCSIDLARDFSGLKYFIGGAAIGVGIRQAIWKFPALHGLRFMSTVPAAVFGLLGMYLDARYVSKECTRRWELYKNPPSAAIQVEEKVN